MSVLSQTAQFLMDGLIITAFGLRSLCGYDAEKEWVDYFEEADQDQSDRDANDFQHKKAAGPFVA